MARHLTRGTRGGGGWGPRGGGGGGGGGGVLGGGGGGAGLGVLERRPALDVRAGHEVVAVEGEQVEGDEAGRRLGRQLGDPRGGGVDPLLEGVEVEAGRGGDHDLAVDDAAVGQLAEQRLGQLGEVAREGTLVAAPQLDVGAGAEHDAPEPVPLGLELPAAALGHAVGGLGQHGRDGRHHGELHGRRP